MVQTGYARVSSTDQTLDLQLEALRLSGCEKIFSEKQSGTTTTGREELASCLEWVREGDVLVVTRLDRLARSVSDLHQILAVLEKKGVAFKCVNQPIDTTTSHGRLMMTMLGAFAEFEADIRRERQMEGIAKAKAEGRYKGGKAKIDPEKIRKLFAAGDTSATSIAKTLGVHVTTVYRAAPDLWGPPPESLRRS